jgi:hypothetical protein
MTTTIHKKIHENPKKFNPHTFLKITTQTTKSVYKDKFETFNNAKHTSRIKIIPLNLITAHYTNDELNTIIH